LIKKFSGWIFASLTGLMLVMIFPPYGYYPLIWVALVPLFFAVDGKTLKQSFFLSYFSGIIFFAGLIYWLVNITFAGTCGLILYLALYFPLFICSIIWLKKSLKLNYLFTAPVVWCFTEYLRAIVMTGFPWDNLGYSFYNDYRLIQITEYIGVSGLSFIAVLGNILFYYSIKEISAIFAESMKRSEVIAKLILKSIVPLVLFFLAITLLREWGEKRADYFKNNISPNKLKVALIQANIPQSIKWDKFSQDEILQRYKNLTESAAKNNPDLIIWPESSLPGFFNYDEKSTYLIFDLIKTLKVPMLFGGNKLKVEKDRYTYYNSVYFVKPGEDLVVTYDKIHLVPYGEYIPNKKFLTKILPKLESIVPFEDFTFGEESKIFELNKFRFGVSICFEDIFPDLVRKIPYQNADFIVNVTNDAWYMKTSAPYQHFFMAMFRAVENRTPFVRCSNTGISGYVGADGKFDIYYGKNGSPIFEEGYMSVDIPKKEKPVMTFYTKFGELFFYVPSVISVLLLMVSFVYSFGKILIRRITVNVGRAKS